jgi:streptogramin lyase
LLNSPKGLGRSKWGLRYAIIGFAILVCWGLTSGPVPTSAAENRPLLVSSTQTNSVLKYDGATGDFLAVFITAGEEGLDEPRGLAFGPDGYLYVSSFGTDEVLRYNGTTGTFKDVFVAAGSGGLDNPRALLFGPDGDLYVTSTGDNSVKRYNGQNGDSSGDFVTSGAGGLDSPRDIVFDSAGDYFYVSSFGTNEVLRYDGTTGEAAGVFVTAGSGGLDGPEGIVFGSDGRLYVASRRTNNVLRYKQGTGESMGVFASYEALDEPVGLLFQSDGYLLVCNSSSDQVLRFNGTNGGFVSVFIKGDGLDQPTYLAEGPEVPADEDPPVKKKNTGSTVAPGGTDPVTSTELLYEDVEQPPSSVTYTVTSGPFNGQLELTTAPETGINVFTQAQIDDGLLVYVHDGSDTSSDSFNFDVNDGQGNTLTSQSFNIEVTDQQNDEDDEQDQTCWVSVCAAGSHLAEALSVLRSFRDHVLLHSPLGRDLVKLYYDLSPPMAGFMAGHEALQATVRCGLIPVVYGLKYPKAAGLILSLLVVGIAASVAGRGGKG